VIKVNDTGQQQELGSTAKAPRWPLPTISGAAETTVVNEVLFNVGRTGTLTPVAMLEPVQVGGVSFRAPRLHNMDEIARLGLQAGDTVMCERAEKVIPHINKSCEEGKSAPGNCGAEFCPECHSRITRSGRSGLPLRKCDLPGEAENNRSFISRDAMR